MKRGGKSREKKKIVKLLQFKVFLAAVSEITVFDLENNEVTGKKLPKCV